VYPVHQKGCYNVLDDSPGPYLPTPPESAKRLQLDIGGFREELPVDHGVEKPVPVLLGHIGHKPRITLSMESDLISEPALY